MKYSFDVSSFSCNNILLAEQSKQEVPLDMALLLKSFEKKSKFNIESIGETVPDEMFDTNTFNESVLKNDRSENNFPPNSNKPKRKWQTKAALKHYESRTASNAVPPVR